MKRGLTASRWCWDGRHCRMVRVVFRGLGFEQAICAKSSPRHGFRNAAPAPAPAERYRRTNATSVGPVSYTFTADIRGASRRLMVVDWLRERTMLSLSLSSVLRPARSSGTPGSVAVSVGRNGRRPIAWGKQSETPSQPSLSLQKTGRGLNTTSNLLVRVRRAHALRGPLHHDSQGCLWVTRTVF
jgi:hypothetical protein